MAKIKETLDETLSRLNALLIVAKQESNFQKILSLKNMIKRFEKMKKKV